LSAWAEATLMLITLLAVAAAEAATGVGKLKVVAFEATAPGAATGISAAGTKLILGIAGGVAFLAPEVVPELVPELVLELVPEDVPEVVPDVVVPELVPEVVPELVPEVVPEPVPDPLVEPAAAPPDPLNETTVVTVPLAKVPAAPPDTVPLTSTF